MVSIMQTVLVLSLFQLCLGATVSDSPIQEDPLHCQLLLPQNQELPWLRSLSDACTAHYQCNLHNAAVHCNELFLKDMGDRCKDGFSDVFYDECQQSAANLYHKVVLDEEVNFLHSRSLKQALFSGSLVEFDEDRFFDDCGTERINFTVIFENTGLATTSFIVTLSQNGATFFSQQFDDVPSGAERLVDPPPSTTQIVERFDHEVKLEMKESDDDWDTIDRYSRRVPKKTDEPPSAYEISQNCP